MNPFHFSPGRAALLAGVLGVSLSASVNAAVINGDFSSVAGNNGTINPPIIFGGYDQAVGSGPWRAKADGIDILGLGLDINPVTSNIGGGDATFTGLTSGTSALGLVANDASLYQITTTAWQPNTVYTLTATVTTSLNGLNASVLANSGIGVGIYSSNDADVLGVDLANTLTDGPANDIEITILGGGTSATVTLTYTTGGTTPSGDVGVRLFVGEGSGITASILGDVTFDNVTLNAVPVPEPSSTVLGLSALGTLALLRRRKN